MVLQTYDQMEFISFFITYLPRKDHSLIYVYTLLISSFLHTFENYKLIFF